MIITLTLNPAFDLHVTLPAFVTGQEHLAESVTRSVGGKGINISRALTENGVENQALVLLGKENATSFTAELTIPYQGYFCDGRIRENITIHPQNGPETRLSFKGFSCDPQALTAIEKDIPDHCTLAFSGSLPQGITEADAKAFLLRLKSRGVQLVLDSKSLSIETILAIQPWLIKPNEDELAAYGSYTALELHQAGIANVLVSLGARGALLATQGQVYQAQAPTIAVRSTIGAGDSMIAGFLATDGTPEERLKTAIAYGSAACLTEGTAPPHPSDIAKLIKSTQ